MHQKALTEICGDEDSQLTRRPLPVKPTIWFLPTETDLIMPFGAGGNRVALSDVFWQYQTLFFSPGCLEEVFLLTEKKFRISFNTFIQSLFEAILLYLLNKILLNKV